MTTANQITPGMTLNIDGKIFRVESSVKVTVAKGTPFVKTKLRNLITEETIEKNFKLDQTVQEVSLIERTARISLSGRKGISVSRYRQFGASGRSRIDPG